MTNDEESGRFPFGGRVAISGAMSDFGECPESWQDTGRYFEVEDR
jgi:hypothetical protein